LYCSICEKRLLIDETVSWEHDSANGYQKQLRGFVISVRLLTVESLHENTDGAGPSTVQATAPEPSGRK